MSLKVGLVGCGHISAAHLRGWRRAGGCKISGLLDLDPELAARRAREFGVARIYDDLDQLIRDCDVVDICSPPHTHAEIALRALGHGRHLLVEKPLVIEVDDWRAIHEAATAAAAVVTVVHNVRFAHSVRTARRWVDDGRVGRLIRFNRRFLTSAESDRMLVGGGHWSHRLPGGRWLETLPHALYLIHHFMGPLELAEVTALRTSGAPASVRADEVLVSLRNDSSIATIEYSANCRLNERTLTLYGVDGRIEIDLLSDLPVLSTLHDRKWRRALGLPYLQAAAKLARGVPERSGYLARRLRGTTPHGDLIAALAAHLRGTAPPPTPIEEIDYAVRMADRIGRAIDRATR